MAHHTVSLLFLDDVLALGVQETQMIGYHARLTLLGDLGVGAFVEELPAAVILLIQLLNHLQKPNMTDVT